MNWRNYIQQPNPVAAALLSKMGYQEHERIQVKKEFLRMLVRMQLDPARMNLVTGFFESYLSLSQEEDELLQTEIGQLQKEEEVQIMEMISSWERRGIEKGIEQGIEKGIEQGIEKGLTEGQRKKAVEVAVNLLKEGVDVQVIIRATGLTKEEVKLLATELDN